MYQNLLFDLDGTMTDPKEGITKSFQYALQAFGVEEELNRLNRVIGPPLIDSFRDFYGFSEEQAKAAVEKYRERFSKVGIFENARYPGVIEMLRALKDKGRTVCLATSKPIVFARQILEAYDMAPYFDITVGSELDGRRNYKNEVIDEVLRQLKHPPLDTVLMIGDRKQDILGAKQCGIAALGVRFGYAEPGELETAGADYLVDTVAQLREFLEQ